MRDHLLKEFREWFRAIGIVVSIPCLCPGVPLRFARSATPASLDDYVQGSPFPPPQLVLKLLLKIQCSRREAASAWLVPPPQLLLTLQLQVRCWCRGASLASLALPPELHFKLLLKFDCSCRGNRFPGRFQL